MFDISIKEATLADAGQYLELERKVRGKTYSGTRSEAEFVEKFGGRKIYLFQAGNKIIGHLAVIKKEGNNVSLSNFVIDPEYQGKGYARKIAALISGKIKNAHRLELAVHPDNSRAVHLYESFGFKIIGRKENYCGDGEPRLIMELINE